MGAKAPEECEHPVRVLRSISARYSRHDFIGNPNVLTWLLRRPPTSFESYFRHQYAAYKAGLSTP